MVLIWVLAGCGLGAQGDLWLHLEGGTRDHITVDLPAGWLANGNEPVRITTAEGSVDLREEARALKQSRVGASRSWVIDHKGDPLDLTLTHQGTRKGRADTVEVAALGPKGRGLTFDLPLKPEALGPAELAVDGKLDVEGIDVDFNEDLCAQLRRSEPRTLLEIRGKKGGVFRVSSQLGEEE